MIEFTKSLPAVCFLWWRHHISLGHCYH